MPQQAFGFRRSVADAQNGCVVSVLSLSNADLTVTCNGQTKTVKATGGDAQWQAVGTDAPAGHFANGKTLGYISNVTLNNGFNAGETYQYSVSQNGTTYTAQIYVMSDGDKDESIFFNTCDNAISIGGQAPGYYKYIRQFAESGERSVVGIYHVDDHYGYVDFGQADDSNGTGHHYISMLSGGTAADGASTYLRFDFPAKTMYEYDYALQYFAAFGLLEDANDPYVNWGHNEDIIWCYRNLGLMPQKGDHDSGANEMGWDTSRDSRYINAMSVWNKVNKPLIQREITQCQNLDTNADHWYKDIGCLRILSPDAISNAGANATTPLDADNGANPLFGLNQIADIVEASKGNQIFTVMGLAHSIRYHMANPPNKFTGLAQNPIADECPAEYAALFTDSDSLMSNPKTNGSAGGFMTLHGDNHMALVKMHNNGNEYFWGVCVGTGTGSINFTNSTGIQEGSVHDGTTLELVRTGATGSQPSGNDYWGCRLDLMQDRPTKELRVSLFDKTNTLIWGKKMIQGRGNTMYPNSFDLSGQSYQLEDIS